MEVDWECLQSAPIFAYSPGSRRRRASDNSMTNKSHSKWLRIDGGWVLVSSRRISARFPAD